MNSYFDVAIEKTILSTLLFNCDELENIVKIIRPSDFYHEHHQQIFQAILELQREDLPIDEEFIRRKVKHNIDSTLIDIISTTPVTNLEAYSKELKNSSLKREIEALGIKVKQFAQNSELSAYQALSRIEESYNHIANNSTSNFLEATPLNLIKEEDTQYICKNYVPLPMHSVVLIAARGGVGKTWASIRIADEIIKEDSQKKVLILATEDRKGKLKSRARKLNINNPNIHISDIDPFFLLEKDPKTQNYRPTEEFYKFKAAIKEYDVVLIDPLIAFYSGKENDNGDARVFMQQLTNLSKKLKKTFALIHHADKDEKGSRGAGAFADATRLTYFVTKDYSIEKTGEKTTTTLLDNGKLRFEVQKQNDDIESVKKLDKITKIADIGSFAVSVFPIKPIIIEYQTEQKKEKTPVFDMDAMPFID